MVKQCMRILLFTSIAGLVLLTTACTRSVSTQPPTSTGAPGSFQQATMEAVLSSFLTQTAQALDPSGATAEATPESNTTPGIIFEPSLTPDGTQPVINVTTTSGTLTSFEPIEHIVQSGEYLLVISRAYGFDNYPQPIIDMNGLTPPYDLYPGQVLLIPNYGPVTPGLEGTPMPGGTTYVVLEGDWILSIARKFGLDPLVITRANNLTFPYLVEVGQVLTIP